MDLALQRALHLLRPDTSDYRTRRGM